MLEIYMNSIFINIVDIHITREIQFNYQLKIL